MKPYIEFNSNRRKMAKTDFESNFYKLQSNSVYGKTIENPKKRSNYQLVNDDVSFNRYVRKATFKNISIFNPNFACIELKKEVVMLNKPFVVGFTVLELAKLHLYQFHYGYMRKLYGDKCKLLFTDTDSLTYQVTNSNVDLDLYQNRKKFDLSNFYHSSPYHCDENKKRHGTFKKEHPNDPIIEFIGLRSKMYSLKFLSDTAEKRAKGIKKHIVKRLQHKNFRETLLNHDKDKVVSYYTIRSNKHTLYTKREQKRSLSSIDDKRYFISKTKSLAYFHYKI